MKIIRKRSLLRYCATLFLISKHIKFGDNKRCFLSFVILFLFIFADESNTIYDMKQVSKITLCLLCVAMALAGCRDKVQSKADTANQQAAVSQSMKRISKVEKQGDMRQYDVADKQRITDFIPKGYKLFEKISGDLNKDGLDDCVLIIKATRKDGFERDYEGKLIDRNRRGIIVLFSEEKGYKVAVKNYNCFSSENEDGGVYFAPYLSIDIRNSKLFVHYAHGRYGYWEYCFRYQDSDFMLIGYESLGSQGPTALGKVSINFLTGVRYDDDNVNKYDDDAEEKFVRKVIKLKKEPLKKLSEIDDFDELEIERLNTDD